MRSPFSLPWRCRPRHAAGRCVVVDRSNNTTGFKYCPKGDEVQCHGPSLNGSRVRLCFTVSLSIFLYLSVSLYIEMNQFSWMTGPESRITLEWENTEERLVNRRKMKLNVKKKKKYARVEYETWYNSHQNFLEVLISSKCFFCFDKIKGIRYFARVSCQVSSPG